MPDPDPASPAVIKEWSSRIECGMTPFLDSLNQPHNNKVSAVGTIYFRFRYRRHSTNGTSGYFDYAQYRLLAPVYVQKQKSPAV